MSHDDHHHAPPPPEPTPPGLDPAAPPPPGAADRADRVAPEPSYRLAPPSMRQADGTLHPIQESAYFSLDPAATDSVSAHIDEYFNQPLDIFPFWESDGKPDRFHVLFDRQIEERFPADRDIRGHIHSYGRGIFARLLMHFTTKRLFQGGALAGLAALALMGPTWFADMTGSQPMGLALAVGAMVAVFGLWWAIQAILFIQYRFRLENDTYAMSRRIVERTRELQNLFTHARAMADQAETQYQQDGKGWGQRALYLTRLTMWIGARMEYLEKFVQMQLWRVRRERYWMRWLGRFVTPLVYLAWWLCAGRDGSARLSDIPVWLVYPLLYVIFALARGAVVGEYPYPFLDVAANGAASVALSSLIILAIFVVLGLLVVAADRALPRSIAT